MYIKAKVCLYFLYPHTDISFFALRVKYITIQTGPNFRTTEWYNDPHLHGPHP